MTYRYSDKSLHSTDLAEESQELLSQGLEVIAASVTIYQKEIAFTEGAETLFVPFNDRRGVAWGAAATWFDARSMDAQFCKEE